MALKEPWRLCAGERGTGWLEAEAVRVRPPGVEPSFLFRGEVRAAARRGVGEICEDSGDNEAEDGNLANLVYLQCSTM